MRRMMRSMLAGSTLLLGSAAFVGPLVTPSAVQASTAAVEKLWEGFSAPTGIARASDGTVYVSNWSGGMVECMTPDGSRSVLVDGVASPAGIAVDGEGSVFVSAYSGDHIIRVGLDGSTARVVEGLATPAGIAFTKDGRLLVANRASGEILSVDLASGERRVVASGLSLPVGVVEMADGSIVASQYGGRVTRVLPDGSVSELGESFSRPGVGILAAGADAVFVIDNGASLVRRVAFDGAPQVVADGLEGSAVALGRGGEGELLVGTWGSGAVYRVKLQD